MSSGVCGAAWELRNTWEKGQIQAQVKSTVVVGARGWERRRGPGGLPGVVVRADNDDGVRVHLTLERGNDVGVVVRTELVELGLEPVPGVGVMCREGWETEGG